MRWVVLLVAVSACDERAAPPRPGDAEPAAPSVAAQTPLPRAPGSARPRLHLTLRSSPPGAAATVDGRVVGMTPVRWEMDDDGRVHEFAFVLRGYAPWRLRFSPSHDGVVHAPLQPIPDEDAGPP
jgi:hypothetical protein